MKRSIWLILLLAVALLPGLGCGDDDDDNDDDNAPIDDDATDDDVADDDVAPDDDTSVDDDVTPDDDTSVDDDVTPDDDTSDDDTMDDDTDPGDELLPTQSFLDRQAEYLQYCSENQNPPLGGIHEQVCRVATGQTEYAVLAIYEEIAQVNNREDTADFGLNSLLRMLWLDKDKGVIPADVKADIEDAVLNFKYWADEPGPDEMCWWSENHQALFHAAELLAGQLFPTEVFPNSGMTGAEHAEKAAYLMNKWLDYRGRFGFSEWHSNVYFNEDMPAILNVVDFAEDSELSLKAAMVMDMLSFDMLNNYYQGLFATAHGRTYENRVLDGLSDSTTEPLWIMYGLGDRGSSGNFSAAFLATSEYYWPPAVLEDIANDTVDFHEHRQADSINIADGPSWGIGYEDYEDIMFWWGMTAYAAPQVIDGTFNMVEDYNMWEGFLWGDISFLRIFVGTPVPEWVVSLVPTMSEGTALQNMSTYTFRTPDYQLSGMQDYFRGMWTAQVHVWQATLDDQAYAFTSAPGGFEDDYMAGNWVGGWTPRALLHRNVGVIMYDRERIPLLEQLLFKQYTHAYFPKDGFDEVVETGHWVIGRKGEGYLALYSDNPTTWSTTPGFETSELIADGIKNVWIVELGSATDNGTFADFVEDIENATVNVGLANITFDSPSLGLVKTSWDGPLTVAGEEIDTGPYGRWDNEYVYQEFGTRRTIVEFDGQRLDLNFANVTRRYWAEYDR